MKTTERKLLLDHCLLSAFAESRNSERSARAIKEKFQVLLLHVPNGCMLFVSAVQSMQLLPWNQYVQVSLVVLSRLQTDPLLTADVYITYRCPLDCLEAAPLVYAIPMHIKGDPFSPWKEGA